MPIGLVGFLSGFIGTKQITDQCPPFYRPAKVAGPHPIDTRQFVPSPILIRSIRQENRQKVVGRIGVEPLEVDQRRMFKHQMERFQLDRGCPFGRWWICFFMVVSFRWEVCCGDALRCALRLNEGRGKSFCSLDDKTLPLTPPWKTGRVREWGGVGLPFGGGLPLAL